MVPVLVVVLMLCFKGTGEAAGDKGGLRAALGSGGELDGCLSRLAHFHAAVCHGNWMFCGGVWTGREDERAMGSVAKCSME